MRALALTLIGFFLTLSQLAFATAPVSNAAEIAANSKVEAIIKRYGAITLASTDSGWQPLTTESRGRAYMKRVIELKFTSEKGKDCAAHVEAFDHSFKPFNSGDFCGVPLPGIHFFTAFYCPPMTPEVGGSHVVDYPQDVEWVDRPITTELVKCAK
jgi:hypothetical protein